MFVACKERKYVTMTRTQLIARAAFIVSYVQSICGDNEIRPQWGGV